MRCSRNAAGAAAWAALLLCWRGALAEFSQVMVTWPDGEEEYIGCMPALFSDEPDLRQQASEQFDLVVAEPKDLCEAPGANEWRGKAVFMWDVSPDPESTTSCSTSVKTDYAMDAGASVMIIGESDAYKPPGYPAIGNDYNTMHGLLACKVFRADADRLLDALGQGQASVQVTFDERFVKYRTATENDRLGALGTTELNVLTPYDIKWHYPAAHAGFNPLVTADERSYEAAEAEINPDCQPLSNVQTRCARCRDRPFMNDAEIAGRIVLMKSLADFSAGYSCIQHAAEWVYHVQRYRGTAMIYPSQVDWGLTYQTRYVQAFNVTIPTYTTYRWWVNSYTTQLDRGRDVVISLPATVGGRGTPYTTDSEDLGALPLALLNFTVSEIGSQSVPVRVPLYAGQAMFSPESYPAVTAPVVFVEVHPSCHDTSGDPSELGHGAECDVCLQKLAAHEFVENAASLQGAVAVMAANDSFCLNDWEDAVGEIASDGAVALVIGADNEHVYTMVDSNTHSQTIPTFNIKRATYDMLRDRQVRFPPDSHEHELHIPPIQGGVATVFYRETGPELPLVQFAVEEPDSLAGTFLAGQGAFNPPHYEAQELYVEPICLVYGCDSDWGGCHKCNMIDNPLVPAAYCSNRNSWFSDVRGKAVLIRIESAQCFMPITNAVLFAEELGARAVIFYNDADPEASEGQTNALGTMHSIDSHNVTIPSYKIERSLGRSLAAHLVRFTSNRVLVRLASSSAGVDGVSDDFDPTPLPNPIDPVRDDTSVGEDDDPPIEEADNKPDGAKIIRGLSSSVIAGIFMSCVAVTAGLVYYGSRFAIRRRLSMRSSSSGTQTAFATLAENDETMGMSSMGVAMGGAEDARRAFAARDVELTVRPPMSPAANPARYDVVPRAPVHDPDFQPPAGGGGVAEATQRRLLM